MRWCKLIVAAAAVALCGAEAVQGQFVIDGLRVSGQLRTQRLVPGLPPAQQDHAYDVTSGTATSLGFSIADTEPYISSLIAGRARWGSVGVYSRAQSNLPNDGSGELFLTPIANSKAGFDEQVTITSSTIPNATIGVATASFGFRGAFGTSDSGSGVIGWFCNAALSATFQAAGTQISHGYAATYRFQGGQRVWTVTYDGQTLVQQNPSGPPAYLFDDTHAITFQFEFGTPFRVHGEIGASSLAQVGGSPGNNVSIISDGMHTTQWNGFSSVALLDGSLVSDFMAIGQTSGTSYNQAIPAPGAISALALVGAMGARRRL